MADTSHLRLRHSRHGLRGLVDRVRLTHFGDAVAWELRTRYHIEPDLLPAAEKHDRLNLIELAWRGGLNAEVTASLFAQ
jgi:hypothetical protein